MRSMIAAGAMLALMSGVQVQAGEATTGCSSASGQQGVSQASIRAGLEGLGYTVSEVEAEHGCFEVKAVNDSGYPIKAYYHTLTGELMQARLARD